MPDQRTDHDRARELAALEVDFSLEAEDAAWLEDHLRACAVCRRWRHALRADARALSSLPDVSAPHRVRDRVLDDVDRRRRSGIPPLFAVAATLVVAIAGTVLLADLLPGQFGARPPGSPVPPTGTVSPTVSSTSSPSPTQTLAASPTPSASPSAAGGVLRFREAVIPSSPPPVDTRDIAAGTGIAVMTLRNVDASALLWWTADGRQWRDAQVPAGAFGGAAPIVLVPFADGFVAAGWVDRQQSVAQRRIWLSPDGRAWRPDDDPSGTLGALDFPMMAVSNTMLIAGGPQGSAFRVFTSRDGTEWTPRRVSGEFAEMSLGGFSSDGTSFYAYGMRDGRPVLWTSPGGATWTALRVPAGSTAISGIHASPGGIVAYGAIDGTAEEPDANWWSRDGRRWRRLTMPGLPGSALDHIVRLVSTRSGLLAVWQTGQEATTEIARTVDGLAWELIDVRGIPPGATIVDVAELGTTIVASGYLDGAVVAWYAAEGG
jgi:hypothetical protein